MTISAPTIFLLLIVGLLSWSFIEYFLHRFIFHYDAKSNLGRQLIYHAHIAHHEDPLGRNRTKATLVLTAPIAIVYWLLAFVLLDSWVSTTFLFVGLATGFFFYKWIHHHCHHGKSRLRVLRYLRRYHLLHHYKTPDKRFGVTSPLFDFVFGTFRPVINRNFRVSRRAL